MHQQKAYSYNQRGLPVFINTQEDHDQKPKHEEVDRCPPLYVIMHIVRNLKVLKDVMCVALAKVMSLTKSVVIEISVEFWRVRILKD